MIMQRLFKNIAELSTENQGVIDALQRSYDEQLINSKASKELVQRLTAEKQGLQDRMTTLEQQLKIKEVELRELEEV